MKVIADTNVLVRLLTRDDPRQFATAEAELDRAEAIVMPLVALCELAWVLASAYRLSPHKIAEGIRDLLDLEAALVDRPAVEAGLAMLDAGGDFADGVIAHDGRWLGGETFVSFDRQAVELLTARGVAARLPA